jgi:NADPH:quinone reductase
LKALLSITSGGPHELVLRDVAEPQPARGELRIAVRACGINYPDVLMIEDRYQFRPERPFSPGTEVCGVVDALGPDTRGFKIGQRVIAYTGWGGLAEKVVVGVTRCTRIPDSMPTDVAASLLINYCTSLHALRDRARLQSGEVLLVLGAGGGVGLAAVQLGKAMGAHVVAAVSSQAKAAVAARLGADATLVYPRDVSDRKALSASFKTACGGEANVVYDPIGGDYAEAALRAIAWKGRYLVVGFAAGVPQIPMNLPLLKGCQICGVFWGAAFNRSPGQHRRNMRLLFDYYERGKIRPEISERFPRLASRQAIGKLVVEMTE